MDAASEKVPDVFVAWDCPRATSLWAIFRHAHKDVKCKNATRLSGLFGFIGSLHIPRRARDCSASATQNYLRCREAGFTVLLSKYFIARIAVNKIAPVFRLGLFYLLGAFMPFAELRAVQPGERETVGVAGKPASLYYLAWDCPTRGMHRQDAIKQKAHSNEWAFWLYWEPSYPSRSSGLFSQRNAKLFALPGSWLHCTTLQVLHRQNRSK